MKPSRAPNIVEEPLLPNLNTAASILAAVWEAEKVEGVWPSILDEEPPSSQLPKGSGYLLARLILRRELYQAYLGLVVSGASIKSASGSVGIPVKLVHNWLQMGSHHFEQGKDTWYSRFFYDMLRAKSLSRARAEGKVREAKPLDWLRNDADNRSWKTAPIAVIEAEMHLEGGSEEGDVEGEVLTTEAIVEAYRALELVGARPSTEHLVRETQYQTGAHNYATTQGPVPECEGPSGGPTEPGDASA